MAGSHIHTSRDPGMFLDDPGSDFEDRALVW